MNGSRKIFHFAFLLLEIFAFSLTGTNSLRSSTTVSPLLDGRNSLYGEVEETKPSLVLEIIPIAQGRSIGNSSILEPINGFQSMDESMNSLFRSDALLNPIPSMLKKLSSTVNINNLSTLFSEVFFRTVANSKTLARALTSIKALSAPEASQVFHDVTYKEAVDLDMPDPSALAKVVGDAVWATFDDLTLPSFATALSNAIAQFLAEAGVLTPENVEKLCFDLYKTLEEGLTSANINDTSESYVQALCESVAGFMTSLGIFTPDKSSRLMQYFAKQMYSLTGIDEPGSDYNSFIESS